MGRRKDQSVREWQVRVLESGQVRVLESGQVRVLDSGQVRVLDSGQVRVLASGQVRVLEGGQVNWNRNRKLLLTPKLYMISCSTDYLQLNYEIMLH